MLRDAELEDLGDGRIEHVDDRELEAAHGVHRERRGRYAGAHQIAVELLLRNDQRERSAERERVRELAAQFARRDA